jgi:predicted transcriptional regulator
MNVPCESYIKHYLPKIRQEIVFDLVRNNRFTQTRASRALGITQASVSKYLSNKPLQIQPLELNTALEQIAHELAPAAAKGQLMQFDYARVCAHCTRKDPHALMCIACAPTH